MRNAKRWVWQTLTRLWSLFTCMFVRAKRARFPLGFLLACVFGYFRKSSFLPWRNFVIDCCGCCDGFYVTGSGAFDVESV